MNFVTKDELNKISERIINAAYKVSNTLGVGFLDPQITQITRIRKI